MGGGVEKTDSSSNASTTSTKTYGNTTTINPYVKSHTTNSGTTTSFAPNTAMTSVYNFTNKNIDNLLNKYLNPTLDSATNQAKLSAYTRTLNKEANNALENNIISPLAQRNMIRSSQATDMYNNLSNQMNDNIANYTDNLLANSQNDTANIINNLMNYALQGWNVINGNQALSLNTSSGNGTTNSNTKTNTNSTSVGVSL